MPLIAAPSQCTAILEGYDKKKSKQWIIQILISESLQMTQCSHLTNTHETLQAQMWTRDILVSRLNHLKDEVIFENVESLCPFISVKFRRIRKTMWHLRIDIIKLAVEYNKECCATCILKNITV